MNRISRTRLGLLLLVCVFLLAACNEGSVPNGNKLATPESLEPAAGICAEPSPSQWALFTLNADIPDPRCGKVRPDQALKIINNTEGAVQVTIGGREVEVEPGGEREIAGAVGTYLAPGVHSLMTSLYGGGGPEVWVLSQ
ncbi:MAG: hypothetical protein JSW37_01290 [Anaerolineales bacterium]|nr:MAG: hypothetical protein JSW37_01290 [Anaerolineales bacterium]